MKCREEDVQMVFDLVGTTPREIERIFESPGNSLNQRILVYKDRRKAEIMETHIRCRKSMDPNFQNETF